MRVQDEATMTTVRRLGAAALAALAGALCTPGSASAQAVPALPEQDMAETATVADPHADTESSTLLSLDEWQPARPPTAAEIDGATTPEAKQKMATTELENFIGSAKSFGRDIRDVIRVRYDEQRERIAGTFDREIDELEATERRRRAEAIERFEEFLRKYPNDPDYSPDAMFRLAELYFEKSADEYLAATQSYEEALAQFDSGEITTEPEPPAPNYAKTISLYDDLLVRFPAYRHADAARYLLGYSHGEMGNEEKSLEMFTALIDNHPTSKFLPEVLTRVGEIYFDQNSRSALEKAIASYSRVLDFKDSPYYDKALYKLAWAYYRLDDFDAAVKNFVVLVQFADAQKKLTGRSGSELRTEALQYIAISLADETWGGVARAEEVLGSMGDAEYVGEMWKRYGEILFDQTRYPLAIEVLSLARDRYPNAPYNPEVQAKIIASYERQRDFDGATRSREVLVEKYDEGQAWFDANRGDADALNKARELTERSLYTAAIYNHQQAQAYKQAGRLADARASYRRAANGYDIYLKRFPESKNSYDFNFYLAECFYYSDDFEKAALQYELVRDSNEDNKHLEGAALSAVITYEKEIERLEAAGKLPKVEFKKSEERGDKPIEAKDVAPVRMKLVLASDRFVTLLPTSDRVPAVAYRAAEVFYNHEQFDEARKRFESIIVRFPGTEVARYSANLIIETYLASKDWDNVQLWSQRLIEIGKAAKPTSKAEAAAQEKLLADLKKFKVGAVFKKAEEKDAAGEFEEAADLYVQLVDEQADHEFADKALFNAAVAYEKVKRFDTASKIYQRIYDNYPTSSLADRALFRVGVNYEKGFDFAGAISAYTKLVERYPNSPHRADALFNVAVTLENMQQYGQAAAAFKRYAQTFPSRDDAGDNFFRAALVYEKMKAWPEMIATLEAFVQRYQKTRAQSESIVQAYKKMGDANRQRNKGSRAVAAYKTCLAEYKARRFRAADRASSFAAECAFEIAEDLFRTYDKIQLVGTGKKQQKSLLQKAQMQRDVEQAYKDVFDFKRVETTLAASYRIGHTYERFAEALFAAEVPPEFKSNEEYAGEYKLQLEEKAAVLERKAEFAYRKAYDEAIKTKVTNEWTQRTLEGLNKYKPDEFPVQKPGKSSLQNFTITGHGLDTLDREPRAAPAAGASANAGGNR